MTALGGACNERETAAPDSCQRYLECLSKVDADLFEDELPVYGSEGTCFANASADTCHEVCQERLDAVDSCTPGSETTAGRPDPDDSGFADCALVDSGTVFGPSDLNDLGFPALPCNPRSSGAGRYQCCSDDPAAPDGALPDYQSNAGARRPLFSADSNDLSVSGLCVDTDELAPVDTIQSNGCPIPCNPTWAAGEVQSVCGAGRVCCQTRPLREADCTLDPDQGIWRPVTGEDIFSSPQLTNWSRGSHATHQDPGGEVCLGLGAGDPSNEDFRACARALSVADQRGFCLPVEACPGIPDEPNACARLD